jgi:hypothetical protein
MKILEKTPAIETQLVQWRREFHRHPETGFREHLTASRIATILGELGCRVRTGVGKTGIVGELGQGHPVVGIRAALILSSPQSMVVAGMARARRRWLIRSTSPVMSSWLCMGLSHAG